MIIELHPEELLDREASGMLTPGERAVLAAHVAGCAACACERRLRVAFADALREPLAPSPPIPSPPMTMPPLPPPVARRTSAAPVATGPALGRARPLRAALGWLAAVAVFAASAAAARELETSALAPSAVHTKREALAHTVERMGVSAARLATRRAAPLAAATATAHPPAPSAESLFEEANRARIRRDYDAAVVAYLRLQDRYPTSREARVSFVTMGRMQLDRADAAGAILSFERYERSGDVELADLAMAGRALALDDVGSDVAPAVWLALLAAHPDSPYASHARLRARAARSSR